MMVQRCRCRIPLRTNKHILNLHNRSQALAFHWRGSRLSFRSPAEPYSILLSAAITAKVTANWECCASCGASCVRAISCSPTGTCVRGTKFICSSSVGSTQSLESIIAAESTLGAVSDWPRAITLSSGVARVAFARSTGKASNHFPSDSRSVKHVSEFSSPDSAAEA